MKFLQSLDPKIVKQLQALAKKRGINLQEYIRAIIIPSYLEVIQPSIKQKNRSDATKKGWETRRLNQEKAELEAKQTAESGDAAVAEAGYPR